MKKAILIFLAVLLAVLMRAAEGLPQYRIHHFDDAEGFSPSSVSCVIQDGEGFIWVATMDGLWRYDGVSFSNYKAVPGDNCPLENNHINYIYETDGQRLLCKSNEMFYYFDRRTRRFSRAPQGLRHKRSVYKATDEENASVAAMPEYAGLKFIILQRDRQQGLWVSSHRGLERLEPLRRTVGPVMSADGLTEEFVRALYADRSRRMWVGDKNGCVRLVSQDGQTRWLAPDGSLSATRVAFGHSVYCIFEDRHGMFWLGTKPDGLFRLEPKNGGFIVKNFVSKPSDRYGLNCNSIYGVAEDGYGRLLVATFGGGLNIVETTPAGLLFHHLGNGLAWPKTMPKTKGVTLTRDGHLLVPTSRGLVVGKVQRDWRRMTFREHHREPARAASLCSDLINSLLVTHSGSVYLATASGVDEIVTRDLSAAQLDFRHFSTREGLPADITLSLAEDHDGHLWVVSEAALGCLNVQKGVSLNYMRKFFDGRFVFSEVPPVCLPSGEMVIGTTRGTLTFQPQLVAKSSFVPPLTVDCDSTVDLYADAPNLDLHLAALDMNQHERITYAYRMEGTDAEWRFAESGELHFAALAPGTYRLHLRSTNGDGVWVDNERVITIVRHASFNESPLAWALYVVLALALLFVAWQTVAYIRRLRRVIREMQLSGGDQMSIVGDQLREIFVSHELPEQMDNAPLGTLTAEERDFQQRCEAFLASRLADSELDVPHFAREMFVSRTKLYGLVKKIYGTSPNNLILNKRLHEAQRLLKSGTCTVAEVAYRCGFSDPKYFSRCFKRLAGMSPSEFAAGGGQPPKETDAETDETVKNP